MNQAPPQSETLVLAHLDLLAKLHARCFEKGWDKTALQSLLNAPGVFGRLVLDRADGTPAGFVLARSTADTCEILTIGVVPDRRQNGYGAHLVESVLSEAWRRDAKFVALEVADDNPAAIALYRTAGFSVVGRRPGYYRRPAGNVDAHIMRRDDKGGARLSDDIHDKAID